MSSCYKQLLTRITGVGPTLIITSLVSILSACGTTKTTQDTVASVIRARRVILTDDEGRQRIEIGVYEEAPQIRFKDKNGNIRLSLSLVRGEESNSSGRSTELATEQKRIVGSPRIALRSETGMRVLTLEALELSEFDRSDYGSPRIEMRDANGDEVVILKGHRHRGSLTIENEEEDRK